MRIKGFLNMFDVIGFIILLGFYIIGFYPYMQTMINDYLPTVDANTGTLFALIPFLLFVLIIYGLVAKGRGQQTPIYG